MKQNGVATTRALISPLYSGPKRYSLNFIRLLRVVITTRTAGKYVIASPSEVRGREVRKMLG